MSPIMGAAADRAKGTPGVCDKIAAPLDRGTPGTPGTIGTTRAAGRADPKRPTRSVGRGVGVGWAGLANFDLRMAYPHSILARTPRAVRRLPAPSLPSRVPGDGR
jgi:hypothetical protein